jgi:hypothetical protein
MSAERNLGEMLNNGDVGRVSLPFQIYVVGQDGRM